MHQKAATRHKSREMQRGGKGFVGDQQLLQRTEEQHTQEPGAAEGAGKASVRQQLEIVVMRVIDDSSVIKAFVRGKYQGEGAQAGAGPGMIAKNMPSVVTHGGAFAAGHCERLHGRKTFEDLAHSQPGYKHESKEQDHATRQNVTASGAAQDHEKGEET